VSAAQARHAGWPGSGRFGKYLAIAEVSFRQRLSERAALIGRAAFYAIVLLVFSRVWQTLFAAQQALPGATGAAQKPGDYVWYLAVTEWIMLSQPNLYLEIESDVRNGDVAYQLGRPLSYAAGKVAEGVGDLGLRLLLLAPFGLGCARLFSGQWAPPGALLLAGVVGLLASLVLLLSYAAIGLCAFWLHDCTPVYLVWQKLLFVLGGLLVPLSLYPEWLQRLAAHLPFATLLYGPGQLVLHPSPGLALRLSLELLGWLAVSAVGVGLLERRGRSVIELHGG